MKRISFSMTEPQFVDRTKTVTRRLGWRNLKPGEHLLGSSFHMLSATVAVTILMRPQATGTEP